MKSNKEIIYNYHEQTKHRPHRYARSLGYLDWDNEPNPFRKFTGAEQLKLPFPPPHNLPCFHEILFAPENILPQPIQLNTLSQLFLYSLGISAWKEYQGTRWAVRCNPSSGNLHPTEAYLIVPPKLLDNDAILFHYDPSVHQFEKRAVMSPKNWEQQGLPSYNDCPHFFIALTSLIWREAWKYGERAFRYCLLDTGHAIASITFSAMALGWNVHYIGINLKNLSTSLGLDRPEYREVEKEFPQVLLVACPSNQEIKMQPVSFRKEPFLFDEWFGTPEKVSPQTINWEIIDKVSSAIVESSENLYSLIDNYPAEQIKKETKKILNIPTSPPCYTLFQQRRSAHAFDINGFLQREDFFQILEGICHIYNRVMKPIIPLSPRTSLIFFLNNIENTPSGIYAYIQNQKHFDKLISLGFENIKKVTFLSNLPFFFLKEGNMRRLAGHLCCGQEIVHDGVLCACIFTDLKEELELHEGYIYAPLHWEAGFIGQLLYLEAEIYNLRGTGIGCFFDDEIILLAKQRDFVDIPINPLYFFTIGKPIIDTKLRTHPPYPYQ